MKGYLLTAPKVLRSNSTELICLSLFNLEGPGNAKLTLTGEGEDAFAATLDHSFTKALSYCRTCNTMHSHSHGLAWDPAGSKECVDFPVPNVPEQRGRLHLQLTLDGVPDYVGNESELVNIREYQNLLFVQTDKSLYLPGQDVRFRILVLDAALKPLDDQVREVWVEDPSGIRIAQWTEPSSTAGFIQLQFQLAQEPPLGNWRIKVDAKGRKREEEKQFEVSEYVLPKYSVDIQAPKVFLGDASTLDLNICARFTHGGAVEGELILRVEPKIYVLDYLRDNYPGFVKGFGIDMDKYTAVFQLQDVEWVSVHHALSSPFDSIRFFIGRFNSSSQMKDCHKASIPAEVLGMDDRELAPSSVNITATVKEKGTGVQFTETLILNVERNPLDIDLEVSPTHFKPGFVYNGLVKVKDRSGAPEKGQMIQICKDPYGSSDGNKGKCRNFTTDSQGLVRFQVPPQVHDVHSISFEVSAPGRQKNYPKNHDEVKYPWQKQIDSYNAYRSVNGWFSPSGSYIQILRSSTKGEVETVEGCEGLLKLQLLYSNSTPDVLHYQVMARGDILASAAFDHGSEGEVEELGDPELLLYKSDKETPDPGLLSKATVEIPVTPEMAPESKLVVFYIRSDGEVVSDHLTFRVNRCLPNKVELEWSEKEVGPGSKVGLKVKAEPESVCGLRVVDKSVDLLKPGDQLNLDKVFQALERFQIYDYESPTQSTDYNFCLSHQPSKNISQGDSETFGGYDSRSHALTSFDRSGLVVLSDLSVYTLPCRVPVFHHTQAFRPVNAPGLLTTTVSLSQPDALADQKETIVGAPIEPTNDDFLPVEVRDYLPETWLWSLENVGEKGELKLEDLEVPDTITEWVGSAVCSSPQAGLGLSSPQSLIASQPFFLDLTLPYSIKRGEILPLPISIFNYKAHPLPIRVELEESESFKVDGDKMKSLCLAEQGNEVVTFDLDFLELGEVNITVVVRVDPTFPDVCGLSSTAECTPLISDGIVKPIRVEPEGFPVEETKNWYLCKGDEEVNVLHSLILPEDVVPDSARAWVTASGDLLGPSLQGIKSLVRLPTGCGEQNMVALAPNIFLLQYFNATDQLKPELKAELTHNMEIGLDDTEGEEGSETGLSAYVLISLLESGAAVDDEVIQSALQCLRGNQNPSTYTLALTTYAFILAGETELGGIYMDMLLKKATENDGFLFWLASPGEPSDAVDIEITSYGILSLVKLDREGDSTRALSAVRWVASKRNSNGGFTSTQVFPVSIFPPLGRTAISQRLDTVMALQALARYATHVGLGDVDMNIQLSSRDWEHTFHLTDENRLVQQMTPVPSVPSEFQISSSGSGCALVQATLRYSVFGEPKKRGMGLIVADTSDDALKCDKRVIQACVMYSGPANTSNMALLQVSMVSGFKPEENALQDLISQSRGMMKRLEVNKETGELAVYFDHLDKEGFCLDIPIVRSVTVKNSKPALVKLLDYYAPEIQDTEVGHVGLFWLPLEFIE
ncbi:unnamed protein product [Darwinula stevensoni]|uniref:TEP1-F n=1 Tax=Darwinula stevensoni TaxID=69355 RepID=A0A7R9FPZ2_9CRUS|nr:unnamed protein product [Darwinula stevensoni]CAG0898545.1 unnamed protein product [Darwinula stevensoni]